MIHRIIVGRLGSLTSAVERSIRNLTSRSFASEVFYVALASAKGHPRRSCLDDLSRHSRPPHIVDICDKASDVKHANASGNQREVLSTFHRFSTGIRSTPSMNLCNWHDGLSQAAQAPLQCLLKSFYLCEVRANHRALWPSHLWRALYAFDRRRPRVVLGFVSCGTDDRQSRHRHGRLPSSGR